MNATVVKSGLLTTLQDGGRPGFAHLGVGRAGAFDLPALRIANALCGNPRNAAALEVTLLGPALRFDAAACVAVTGAPIPLSVHGVARPNWAPVYVPAGATVGLGAMSHGCRSYLAIRGGFDVDPVLGSRSTDVNAALGPLDGRPIKAGDTLQTGSDTPEPGSGSCFGGTAGAFRDLRNKEPGRVPWRLDPRPWYADAPHKPLRLLPGIHLERVARPSRDSLFSEPFVVGLDSNRVGVRLTGPRIGWTSPVEMVSEGCIPGLLQLPPSGHPIAFGPECPVSGGYPRIGQIAAVDIPRLAQLRPGDALRFRPCTFEEAVAALRRREGALCRLEAAIHRRLRSSA